MKLIFEKSRAGRQAVALPECDVPMKPVNELIPSKFLRSKPAELPEVSELDIVRHYIELSHRTMGIDTNFYPLGSCTMKYNPKVNEKCVALSGLAQIHPLQSASTVQGALQIFWELERLLIEISGMDAITLQPAAGAHGELTGLMMVRAYLHDQGQTQRTEVLIPDSAHGTNPATSSLCGFKVVQVKSNKRGTVDMDDLAAKLSDKTAAMMITNPNTLGLFEEHIVDIAELLHRRGAQLYMDGANMNAIVGITRPGDFGVDVMHFNLHKTFSTPHGGGGPGAGPVAVKKHLEPYLPIPRLVNRNGAFGFIDDCPRSIGKVKSFYGNAGMLFRAYIYIRCHGAKGLRRIAENAVLNANYLCARLKKAYDLPYNRRCMHEFVLSARRQRQKGVRALDIAKRLLDYGFHAPTIYFPLIVPEALMIEPTETENKETLDSFVDAMLKIAEEAEKKPELVQHAPYTKPVKRLDEVKAAREPKVRWKPA